jgi:hypothetical protein
VERSFGTDQDRLVKQLRLARVKTMEGANEFLAREYWPEWNERFARPLAGFTDLHRPLTKELDLASALSYVEQRVIANDYTFSFGARRYQIARSDTAAGMKRQRLRVELRLDGSVWARYEGRWVGVGQCFPPQERAKVPAMRKPVRKDHNARGKSSWMDGFFEQPGPPLWLTIGNTADRSR